MTDKRSRYHELERFLTALLFLALAMFIVYLLAAGFGWKVMKIIGAVVGVLVSGYGLWTLHASKELLRPRSLWLTYAYGSVILCTIVSLLCNFPRA